MLPLACPAVDGDGKKANGHTHPSETNINSRYTRQNIKRPRTAERRCNRRAAAHRIDISPGSSSLIGCRPINPNPSTSISWRWCLVRVFALLLPSKPKARVAGGMRLWFGR